MNAFDLARASPATQRFMRVDVVHCSHRPRVQWCGLKRFGLLTPRRSLPPSSEDHHQKTKRFGTWPPMRLGDCRFNRGISFQLVIAFKKQGVFFNRCQAGSLAHGKSRLKRQSPCPHGAVIPSIIALRRQAPPWRKRVADFLSGDDHRAMGTSPIVAKIPSFITARAASTQKLASLVA